VQSPDTQTEVSARFIVMSRSEIIGKEEWSRQIEEFAKTGIEN